MTHSESSPAETRVAATDLLELETGWLQTGLPLDQAQFNELSDQETERYFAIAATWRHDVGERYKWIEPTSYMFYPLTGDELVDNLAQAHWRQGGKIPKEELERVLRRRERVAETVGQPILALVIRGELDDFRNIGLALVRNVTGRLACDGVGGRVVLQGPAGGYAPGCNEDALAARVYTTNPRHGGGNNRLARVGPSDTMFDFSHRTTPTLTESNVDKPSGVDYLLIGQDEIDEWMSAYDEPRHTYGHLYNLLARHIGLPERQFDYHYRVPLLVGVRQARERRAAEELVTNVHRLGIPPPLINRHK